MPLWCPLDSVASSWLTSRHCQSPQGQADSVADLAALPLVSSAREDARQERDQAEVPVFEVLVKRDFTADDVNEQWLTNFTEYRSDWNKLYLCAV